MLHNVKEGPYIAGAIGICQWRATIGLFNSSNIKTSSKGLNALLILKLFSNFLTTCPSFVKNILLTCQFPPLINCICFSLLFLSTPFLIAIYFMFLTFPGLCFLTKSFHNLNKINVIFGETFLYMYITVRFIYNILLHLIIFRRKVSKHLLNYLGSYVFFLQLCIFFNTFFNFSLLIRCGDIETNPGPNNLLGQSFSVCQWNLNGIAAHNYVKLSMLEAYNAVYKYDVICLSETFLDSSHSNDDQSLNFQGYKMIRADHPNNTKHGGVCMYYKEHLPLKIRSDISTLKECLVVEIKVNRQKIFISCIYRSPSQSSDEFDDFYINFENTLSKLNVESPLCSIVLGDFNAKCSKWYSEDISDRCGLELETLSTCSGFSQLIREPTNREPNKTPVVY